jgi:autotransporter translocation and assembly factor TamB
VSLLRALLGKAQPNGPPLGVERGELVAHASGSVSAPIVTGTARATLLHAGNVQRLEAELPLSYSRGLLTVSGGRVTLAGGNAKVNGWLREKDRALHGSTTLEGLSVRELTGQKVGGALAGRIDFEGTLAAPKARGRLRVPDLSYQKLGVANAETTLAGDYARLHLEPITLKPRTGGSISGKGDVSLAQRTFDLRSDEVKVPIEQLSRFIPGLEQMKIPGLDQLKIPGLSGLLSPPGGAQGAPKLDVAIHAHGTFDHPQIDATVNGVPAPFHLGLRLPPLRERSLAPS